MGFNSGFKGLNAASRAYPLLRDTRTDTQMGKIILQWKKKNYVIAEGKLVNCFYNCSNVFCMAITDSRSLAFQVGELNHFHHTPNKDGYRREERYCGFTRHL